MEKNNNLFGLDLKVDNDYIESVVKNMVTMGIMQALDEKNGIACSIVTQILNQKVDDKGKISSYSSDNKFTLLEYYVNTMIRDESVVIMKEVLEEKRVEVRNMIKKEMQKKSTIDSFYNAFFDGVVDNLNSTWNTTIDVNVNKKKEY